MAGISLDDVPDAARTAWLSLRDQLKQILGDDLVAMWAYGGTTATADPPHAADLDTYVVVARRPDDESARMIEDAHESLARDLGVEWDVWYVLVDDARRADPPRHAWRDERRDTSWAVNRAHWLAGRYANLHGADPSEIVATPTWEELEGEIDRELEHIERHVVEGDTDPYEATYALLNGSRILYSLETHSVATSKRAAGTWALEHLPARWHAALRAAIRTYDGHPEADDAALLADEMARFVAFVREQMPPVDGRPTDALPRWSGA